MINKNIYPKMYLSMYKTISVPIPLVMFPERVQEILKYMEEINLIDIHDEVVVRKKLKDLDKDFVHQLSLI